MKNIKIKKLTVEDFKTHNDNLERLFRESFVHSFPETKFTKDFIQEKVKQCADFLKADEATVIGLLENEQLVGLAYTYLKNNMGKTRLHLNHIAILPEKLQQGLGTLLMIEVSKLAGNLAACEISLDVSITNSAAVEFYEKLGFTTERLSCIKKV